MSAHPTAPVPSTQGQASVTPERAPTRLRHWLVVTFALLLGLALSLLSWGLSWLLEENPDSGPTIATYTAAGVVSLVTVLPLGVLAGGLWLRRARVAAGLVLLPLVVLVPRGVTEVSLSRQTLSWLSARDDRVTDYVLCLVPSGVVLVLGVLLLVAPLRRRLAASPGAAQPARPHDPAKAPSA